ncbi:MAG: hypothetical protein RL653_2647, partial [Pseudomonadota bacterium]
MADEQLAVEISGLKKRFKRRQVKGGYTTLKTELVAWLLGRKGGTVERRELEVLKGLELRVPRGKTVAIIGQNGSGKSTLLKVLTGIYAPTEGTAVVRGRISALLELGAGFHPDFSGRENIFVNGTILGLGRAELRERMEEIIAFSELGDFIDEPVRTYSSGMYMRLAFSVATFVDPDVLIIDEILSVGDEHFGRKSRAKMEEFKERGKTILLVTHDLGTVERWCDLAAWLDEGRIAAFGEPRHVVAAYRQKVAERELGAQAQAQVSEVTPEAAPQATPDRFGNRTVALEGVRLLNAAGAPVQVVDPEAPCVLEMDYVAEQPVEDAVFGMALYREDGLHLYGTNTLIDGVALPVPLPPAGTVRFVVP